MRYSSEHKEETRRRILAAAGRGFRKEGFSLAGVDGLARSAGVTSGAFYGHFRSKAEAFRAALSSGMEELRAGIEACQAQAKAKGQGPEANGWVEALAEFYFTNRVTCDLADGCALPSLTPDVARADAKTKATFQKDYLAVVAALAKGLSGADAAEREARAIVVTALLAGGVTLARSVRDKAQRDRIANAVRHAVIACARERK